MCSCFRYPSPCCICRPARPGSARHGTIRARVTGRACGEQGPRDRSRVWWPVTRARATSHASAVRTRAAFAGRVGRSRARARAHTRTSTHTCRHTSTHAHANAQKRSHKYTYIHARARALTRTRTGTGTHTHTHAHTHTHTTMHVHKRTHARARTHTHRPIADPARRARPPPAFGPARWHAAGAGGSGPPPTAAHVRRPHVRAHVRGPIRPDRGADPAPEGARLVPHAGPAGPAEQHRSKHRSNHRPAARRPESVRAGGTAGLRWSGLRPQRPGPDTPRARVGGGGGGGEEGGTCSQRRPGVPTTMCGRWASSRSWEGGGTGRDGYRFRAFPFRSIHPPPPPPEHSRTFQNIPAFEPHRSCDKPPPPPPPPEPYTPGTGRGGQLGPGRATGAGAGSGAV
jgi:hypothetical protein